MKTKLSSKFLNATERHCRNVLVALGIILLVAGGPAEHSHAQAASKVITGATASGMEPGTRSSIKIYDLKTGAIRVLYTADGFYEGPYYSRDGKYIYFEGGPNQKLYRIPASGGEPQIVDIGDVKIKHDHGFSPDGKWLAMNVAGGTQLLVSTATGTDRHAVTPSDQLFYFHAWSPDSRWILGGSRTPDTGYAIYRIHLDGSDQQPLTRPSDVINDVPDYTSDGRWIYFNSDQTGSFEVWRMPASGAGPGNNLAERVTNDPMQDWWPHPSPNGKWLLFASYSPDVRVKETMPQWMKEHPGETISHFNLSNHPYNQNVEIRIRPLPGEHMTPAPLRVLTQIIGGQGSLNINSWSPDSKQFVFASYEAKK
jgi:Tol biopolymer transport system component